MDTIKYRPIYDNLTSFNAPNICQLLDLYHLCVCHCVNIKCFIKSLKINYHYIEVKIAWKISYSPVNGASLGSYFCFKNFTSV